MKIGITSITLVIQALLDFLKILLLLLLLLLCFTTQVVEARGDERQKKSEVHRLC